MKEHVLPNYDDVPAIYRDLINPLISAVKSARDTPAKPIDTPFGQLEGRTATDVARLVVEIFDIYRYVEIEEIFDALCQIFRGETDDQIRKQILETVQHLSKYDFGVWEEVGPRVQAVLIDVVERTTADDQEGVRPILLAAWGGMLNSEVTGTSWSANSVTLSSGSLPVSIELKKIRDKAITGLLDLFDRAVSDEHKREVVSTLREATHLSPGSGYSNDLLGLTLTDGNRIVAFFADNVENLSYEIRESMEHDYLFDYHRAREIAEDEEDRFGCRPFARGLMESIVRFRDRANTDQQFVRYKTLVGFQAVFDEHWDDEERDFAKVEEFRSNEAERFVDEIAPQNEREWFAFIERCAATKWDDGATFTIFEKFLNSLARRKPETAKRLLSRANSDLLIFLTAFFNGLLQSEAEDIYLQCTEGYLESGTHLTSLVRHRRLSKPGRSSFIKAVLRKAIATGDDSAVTQCVLLAMEAMPADGAPANDEFFRPALAYLTSQKNARWVRGAWFARMSLPFFDLIGTEDAKLLLENLLGVRRIEFRAEDVLCQIARKHPALVWEYFGHRLRSRAECEGEKQYEAVPYQLHGLEKELSKDAKLAISFVRSWYEEDSTLFQYRGGRLLSRVFVKFQAEISDELCGLVASGTETDAEFALAVMLNYHGEPATHEILKRIVAKYPGDESKLSRVSISFDSTGVVTGEFGFVEAMRQKKAAMELWKSDPRPEVRVFAEKHIRALDLSIADEQRRAEERMALRKIQFRNDEDDGEKKGDDPSGED